jgi:hypothetical protein
MAWHETEAHANRAGFCLDLAMNAAVDESKQECIAGTGFKRAQGTAARDNASSLIAVPRPLLVHRGSDLLMLGR